MKKSIIAIFASAAMVTGAFFFSSIISVNEVICSNVEALTDDENVTFESQYAYMRNPGSISHGLVRSGESKKSSLCLYDSVNLYADDGECLEITIWSN